MPKQPDVDAIADSFFIFKGRNKLAKVFSPKQGMDLYLVIDHNKYEAALQHLFDESEDKIEPQVSNVATVACYKPK